MEITLLRLRHKDYNKPNLTWQGASFARIFPRKESKTLHNNKKKKALHLLKPPSFSTDCCDKKPLMEGGFLLNKQINQSEQETVKCPPVVSSVKLLDLA